MLWRSFAGFKHFLYPAVGHPFTEQIRHAAHEYILWLCFLRWLAESVLVEGWGEHLRVWCVLLVFDLYTSVLSTSHGLDVDLVYFAELPEPGGDLPCVAVFAFMEASCDGIKGIIAPFDLAFIHEISHPTPMFSLCCCVHAHIFLPFLCCRDVRPSVRIRRRKV